MRFLRKFSRLWDFFTFTIDPLEEQLPRHFYLSDKKGSTVLVDVPDDDGGTLVLFFQRPIMPLDVKHGKLLPNVWTNVKRRGGKRQTAVRISLERAEMLHVVLGEALKNARAKQQRTKLLDRLVTLTEPCLAEEMRMGREMP